MTEREKVITHLQIIHTWATVDAQYNIGINPACCKNVAQWTTDAIALLKAQEPRVMTLEEVAGRVVLERETPIYMEFGYMSTHAGQVIGLNPKYMYFDDENGLSWDVCEGPDRGKKDGVSLDEYNDIWRCWSARPTDEQREAVKWDE